MRITHFWSRTPRWLLKKSLGRQSALSVSSHSTPEVHQVVGRWMQDKCFGKVRRCLLAEWASWISITWWSFLGGG